MHALFFFAPCFGNRVTRFRFETLLFFLFSNRTGLLFCLGLLTVELCKSRCAVSAILADAAFDLSR